MQTIDQKQQFLDMQEHPENYTDEQLEAMMDSLDQVPDVHAEWKIFEAKTVAKPKRAPLPIKIAASFVGVLLLSGTIFAAIHIASQRAHDESGDFASPTPVARISKTHHQSIRFDDMRLDSILTVVSAHYGKVVSFRSNEAKAMKFIMTWQPDQPLADFIERMNLFDGLRLTLQQDTIIIETIENKVSK